MDREALGANESNMTEQLNHNTHTQILGKSMLNQKKNFYNHMLRYWSRSAITFHEEQSRISTDFLPVRVFLYEKDINFSPLLMPLFWVCCCM